MCMAERGFTSFELDGVMKSSEKGMAEVKRNVEIIEKVKNRGRVPANSSVLVAVWMVTFFFMSEKCFSS